MSIVKEIKEDDFLAFTALVVKMYKAIDKNINDFYAINMLMHCVKQKGFVAFGIYEENVLKGCTFGFEELAGIFHFAGIYTEYKCTYSTKYLIDESLKAIQHKGYKTWEVHATNSNIASIMEKYKAKVQYTKYSKDF